MYIQQLKSFCAIVEQGTISRAATLQHCSQPAMTKQLHSLEEELGQQLFAREGKKLTLNSFGQIVYSHSRKILAELEVMGGELNIANLLANNIVKFGATNLIGIHILPAKLAEFKAANLDCAIFSTVDFLNNIIRLLEADQISFAFLPECEYVHTQKNLQVVPFMRDEMLLLMSPKHPWAKRKSVKLKELEDVPFLISQPQSATRRYIEAALAKRHIVLKNQYDMYSIETIKQALLQGDEVSIISQGAVQMELHYKILVTVPLENFTCTRDLYVVWKKNKKLTNAEEKFILSFGL